MELIQETETPNGAQQLTLNDDELVALQVALDKRVRKWRSRAYDFFDAPRIVQYNGGIAQAFTCLNCDRTLHRMQDTLDSASTSNLLAHVKQCVGEDELEAAAAAYSLDEQIPTDELTPDEMRLAIVRWISQDLRPVSIVRDRGFLRIIKAGRRRLWIPSPQTVIRDLNVVYNQAFDEIYIALGSVENRVHITSDAWTSPNHLSLVAFFVHYATHGKMQHFLLDIVDVAQSHTGSHLAKVLCALLNRYGLTDKFMATTLDNASNNKAMVASMARQLPSSFKGEQAHGNCFAHILNLIAKAFTSSFERKAADEADEDDYDLPSYELDDVETMEEADDADNDSELPPLVFPIEEEANDDGANPDPDEEDDALRTQAAAISTSLSKIRRLAIKIQRSPTVLRPFWYNILTELELKPCKIPRDVTTRWNSTFQLLRFTLLYQPAIERVALHRDLRAFELTPSEWEMLKKLKNALQAFYDATEFFSRSDFPGICYVLRSIYTIDELLEELVLQGGDPALQAAARLARKKLAKYKHILAGKEIYQFATVFHPRRKLQFFQSRPGFGQAWVRNLSERMADVFADEYLPEASPRDETTPERPLTFAERMHGASPVKPATSRHRRAGGAGAAAPEPVVPLTELDLYLNAPIESTEDVIAWWYNRRDQYPNLSKMAIDYCSIPATTVDVERLFSTGRMLLSWLRNRLSADSVHSIMSLKSWWDANVINDSMFTL